LSSSNSADRNPTPDYAKGVEFHRTTGGWDGHPYQGFVHGEIIHRKYVAKNYPGDIFDQRRMVLGQLPRQDYKNIFEMGTSSGHFTVPLQETFPDAQITGCDMSATMMEQAQRAANERGWKWRLLQVPAEDTGLESESFDLVASFILMHEMPASAIRAIFEEAYRLLEPGGDMLMSDVRPFRDMDRLTEWRAYYVAVNGGEPHWLEAATIDLAATAEEVGFVNARSGPAIEEFRYPWVTVAHKPE
jgi:ubiquinone/menaquinone biosynthesis C-methylase UbiE